MLPDLFRSSNISVLQEVVQFAQARHGVLAGNIANMNTPGYQTRDLSVPVFQQRLKEAISRAEQPARPSDFTRSQAILSTDPDDPIREVGKDLTNLMYHDGTNINLEQQIAEINKNQMLHNVALTVMTNQFALLQTAISERV